MSQVQHYKSRDGSNRNNRRYNQDRRFTKQEQYERNYQYVIRNISENLKRGSYRNISSLQRDLEKLQNNQFCQEYSQINIEDQNEDAGATHNKICGDHRQQGINCCGLY